MTLFASDISNDKKSCIKTGLIYLIVSIFVAVFGAIYELFSHGVYSYFMIYAFSFPLIGGLLPFFLLSFSSIRKPGRIGTNLYHSGIATLTVGSIFEGIIAIYGTTSFLSIFYWITGSALVVIGLICYIISLLIKRGGKPVPTEIS